MAGPGGTSGISIPLVLLCLGLSAWAYQLAGKPIEIPPPSPIAPSAGELPAPVEYKPYQAPTLAELDETAARPLFSETRRPPVAPAVAETAEPEPANTATPLTHTLVGIFTKAETKLALLRPKGRGPNLRVRVGDMVDGWTIVAITPEQVKLEQAGKTQILIPKPPVLKKPRRPRGQRPPRRPFSSGSGGAEQRLPPRAVPGSRGLFSPS